MLVSVVKQTLARLLFLHSKIEHETRFIFA